MTIFMTSDTHFSHRNIIHLGEGRPFSSIEEHDEALVENWNSKVRPDDTVIHLGDVAFGHREETLKTIDRLNGYKILIPGNHDNISSLYPKKIDRWMPIYLSHFDQIWAESSPASFGGQFVMLSHYPPAEIPDHGEEDRYPHLRPELNSVFPMYIHGHTHQQHTVTELSNGAIAYNVGVDSNGFAPVPVDEIMELLT